MANNGKESQTITLRKGRLAGIGDKDKGTTIETTPKAMSIVNRAEREGVDPKELGKAIQIRTGKGRGARQTRASLGTLEKGKEKEEKDYKSKEEKETKSESLLSFVDYFKQLYEEEEPEDNLDPVADEMAEGPEGIRSRFNYILEKLETLPPAMAAKLFIEFRNNLFSRMPEIESKLVAMGLGTQTVKQSFDQ